MLLIRRHAGTELDQYFAGQVVEMLFRGAAEGQRSLLGHYWQRVRRLRGWPGRCNDRRNPNREGRQQQREMCPLPNHYGLHSGIEQVTGYSRSRQLC